MWPWEHAIMGYLVYSLFARVYYRESPGGLDAFAAVFASVLPDLIDKPLAWEFGVFDAGYALGHSIFFAIPLSIAVGALARSSDRPRAGVAFALGYLLHLPADVVDGYVRDGAFNVWIMLWPLGREQVPDHGHGHGFVEQFAVLFGRYQQELLSGDPSTYILVQMGMLAAAAGIWLYDGAPVARELLLWCKRALESSRRS
ncbi:metal-dependent hydrolase [Natronolimnohabitans innermongolicus]|uniref:Membrane-bound metal-dependent hydrolase n=1 Tax=Natronolimnohabitans innermongolicus JCM 12255 TaxID=1227499 RepID=L9X054_9EURY|nr:metal-dependent hydrolase [Natronolimnohabitans innermongolicus]ELY55129.1 membrane-bound metal-dependent hydrolase [Natronolimnohabitans innermongolicus JCM 12255]